MTDMRLLFGILEGCFSPVCIAFAVILLGCSLGKIRIKGISLDLAGVLITAILYGMLRFFIPEFRIGNAVVVLYDASFADAMNILSLFGTALFVAAIGLSAGYTVIFNKARLQWCFLLGAGMVALNFLLMLLLRMADQGMDIYLLYGTFCGAMTSTPGLAAVCEHAGAQLAPVGYAGAYLFGVIGVVLFVQMIEKKIPKDSIIQGHKAEHSRQKGASLLHGMMQLSAVILLGYAVGSIRIPWIHFSLGNSGGILISGILVGALVMKTKTKMILTNQMLSCFRCLGLMLFFVGSGIPAGVKLPASISIKSMVYGVIFTMAPILIGYILAMRLTHKNRIVSLSAVCGIMTSTPAIGVLLERPKTEPDTAVYSVTYTGALLAMVICMRLL